ncbi:leucyl aminopeptidase [Corynebacterium lizhenjunii]|uniref:Probable cytosol aminopeptidase n=1 Tax=Corynebacterium lizhenjunii TaxID=2709394 RepID=A0A7T0KE98_9CORY|nr:leucyl aminopeptidase [Corynebacterium lizhenjunii]QPK78534.1 leucyl aminopeptidase [Corynebacterium lizhenjunii]
MDAMLITAVCSEGKPSLDSSLLTHEIADDVAKSLDAVGATGKAGEVTRVPAPDASPAASIVVVGLGAAEDVTAETIRRSFGAAARSLAGVGTVVVSSPDQELGAAVEGVILGGYTHRGLRAESADAPASFIFVYNDDAESAAAAQEAFAHARITAEATVTARDLVNTPSNLLFPQSYADYLSALGAEVGLEVEVVDEAALAEQGFGGILSVGQGSARPPRLVRMSYTHPEATHRVALVGKGITFDTGGISLKPGAGMWDMISDMGGSAAVAASIVAAAKLELKVNVTATIPLAENMPSGTATRPGDVITHYGGITSEVLNTDAEGRLVLADAIARACEDQPDYLIETATLTGAQLVALGTRTAGVMGSEEFRDRVAAVGRSVGENAWAMPLLEEHEESIKSPVADIRNIDGKREGGMEFAGTYLSKFVADGVEWAHIDVAGPSWNGGGPFGYTPKRATGAPVRTIIATLADIAAS